ncbi:hypothetical protein BV898_04432 [Hypsibius exemplaris]|uniref:Uncharacterized protein n=1 Tax=Hypsibius exemplaris TaxID=2072580 RepID=A0A1W0X2D5_HYPEX|nr:hypothetical protein BV898_04432 [Hypsibius exemplaris]
MPEEFTYQLLLFFGTVITLVIWSRTSESWAAIRERLQLDASSVDDKDPAVTVRAPQYNTQPGFHSCARRMNDIAVHVWFLLIFLTIIAVILVALFAVLVVRAVRWTRLRRRQRQRAEQLAVTNNRDTDHALLPQRPAVVRSASLGAMQPFNGEPPLYSSLSVLPPPQRCSGMTPPPSYRAIVAKSVIGIEEEHREEVSNFV